MNNRSANCRPHAYEDCGTTLDLRVSPHSLGFVPYLYGIQIRKNGNLRDGNGTKTELSRPEEPIRVHEPTSST
jgi:hypothetical protein